MLRTIDRYILRNFFGNYVLALFVLISLYVVLDLFVNLDEFTKSGQQPLAVLRNIGDYYYYNLPLYFSQLAGVITLFAACGTLARLQRQNEITAVLASGTSLYRLAAPLVLAAVLMNALLVLNQEVLLPKVAAKLARTRDDVEGSRVYKVWCVRDGEDRLISAQRFSPKEQRIRDFIALELSSDPRSKGRMRNVIKADKAEWDPQGHGWKLQSGRRISISAASTGVLSADDALIIERIDFYPSALTPEDLLLRQQSQWIKFLSLAQLDRLEKRGDVDAGKIIQVKHGRYTLPVCNIILLLLGISFFLSRLPEGVLTQAAKALGVCAVMFIFSFAGQQMVGTAGLASGWSALPAWLPIFLFGPLAVILLDGIKT